MTTLQSIFSGQTSIKSLLSEGKKYLEEKTGQMFADPKSAAAGGMLKAVEEDDNKEKKLKHVILPENTKRIFKSTVKDLAERVISGSAPMQMLAGIPTSRIFANPEEEVQIQIERNAEMKRLMAQGVSQEDANRRAIAALTPTAMQKSMYTAMGFVGGMGEIKPILNKTEELIPFLKEGDKLIGKSKYLYHGTSPANLQLITKEGLVTSKPAAYDYKYLGMKRQNALSLTTDAKSAYDYSAYNLPEGTEPIVLRIRKDAFAKESFLKDPEAADTVLFKGVVPPKYLEIQTKNGWKTLAEWDKVGEATKGTLVPILKPTPVAPTKLFHGLPNLSTKLLEKFRGMPERIKQGQFEEIVGRTRKEGLKPVDEQLVRSSLVVEDGMVNLPKTAAKVEEKLVPLKPTLVKYPRWSNIGEDFIGDGKYGEIVYQSPIKTNAGDVHFYPRDYFGTRGELKQEGFPNYFSHTRYEDMADGKTRKILETQSDLFQKGAFEQEFIGKKVPGITGRGVIVRTTEEQAVKLRSLEPYSSNDPLAHLRTFREEVKRAAKDGKDTLLIPSGETAMKIEGLGAELKWVNPEGIPSRELAVIFQDSELMFNSRLLENDLHIGKEIADSARSRWIITDVLGEGKFKAMQKGVYEEYQKILKVPGIKKENVELKYGNLAETFDISGKVDTQHFVYKLNEEAIPREARKMGLNVEGKIKADNGEWWKINIPPEKAKEPVTAFGATTIGTLLGGAGVAAAASMFPLAKRKYEEIEKKNNFMFDSRKQGSASISAYSATTSQTDIEPHIMASGKRVYEGAIASGDRSIPLGTKVKIGDIVYTVEDYMNKKYDDLARHGKRYFDIFMNDTKKAIKFGRKSLDYMILDKPEPSKIFK